jgi:hypothetical protein
MEKWKEVAHFQAFYDAPRSSGFPHAFAQELFKPFLKWDFTFE